MPAQVNKGLKEKFIDFFSHEPQWYWIYYKLELACILVLLTHFAILQKGKTENNKIAANFGKITIPTLFNEFPQLGCTTSERSHAILQKSYSEYQYFASGRKNCTYAEFTLSLLRRHCFFTNFVIDKWLGKKDTLTIDIPINLEGRESSLPLEFFVCMKKDLKGKLAEYPHLN